MSDANLEVRMHNIEKLLERIDERLDVALKNIDDHEERLRSLEARPVSADVDDHEQRLRAIEGKSGLRFDALVGQIIGLGTAAFIGWLLGRV